MMHQHRGRMQARTDDPQIGKRLLDLLQGSGEDAIPDPGQGDVDDAENRQRVAAREFDPCAEICDQSKSAQRCGPSEPSKRMHGDGKGLEFDPDQGTDIFICLGIAQMKGFFPIAAALVPVSAWAAETPAEAYPWMSHMMWDGGWYGMIFGPLLMVLVLAVVIAVAVLIVRALGGHWQGSAPPHYPPPGRNPIDILRERFARGEIDKNEFEERRRVLQD